MSIESLLHGTVMIQVFTGNQEMCLKIRGYQVQRIVELLAVHQLDASEFLDLLKAVVKAKSSFDCRV